MFSVPIDMAQLERWADRKGTTVEWGNIVGWLQGQTFREVFKTEDEAKERERQALAKEAIGADRAPIATERYLQDRDTGDWRLCARQGTYVRKKPSKLAQKLEQ